MRKVRRQSRVEEVSAPRPQAPETGLLEKARGQTDERTSTGGGKAAPKNGAKPATRTRLNGKRSPNLGKKDKETYDKSRTNSRQLASNKPAISQQLASKQTDDKPAISQQLASNKPAMTQNTFLDTPPISQQISQQADDNKPAISQQLASKRQVSLLTGKEALLAETIFRHCQNSGCLETKEITSEYLRKTLEVSPRRLRNLVERLTKKGIFEVTFSKRGNGGTRRFKLLQEHYQNLSFYELASNKPAISQQLASNKPADKPADKPASGSSSSSDHIYKTTTTGKNEEKRLLGGVSIPEEVKKIGFGVLQIQQLGKIESLTVERVQESLDHFAFDLTEGKTVIKTNPLNFLMGSLRNGGYTSSGYVEEEQGALDRQLALLSERNEKRKREKEKLEELLFGEWLETKTKEELVGIEEPGLDGYMGIFHKNALKCHFVEKEMLLFQDKFCKELDRLSEGDIQ